jgi:hypothetical protein
VYTSQSARRNSAATEIRQVHNVAFADAEAKAGVSPWTPAMFKVSTMSPQEASLTKSISCISSC